MSRDLIILNRIMLILFSISLIIISIFWIISIMTIDKALPAIIVLLTGILYTGYVELLIRYNYKKKSDSTPKYVFAVSRRILPVRSNFILIKCPNRMSAERVCNMLKLTPTIHTDIQILNKKPDHSEKCDCLDYEDNWIDK